MKVSETEPTRIVVEVANHTNTVASKAKPIIEYKDGRKEFVVELCFFTVQGTIIVHERSRTSLHVVWDY